MSCKKLKEVNTMERNNVIVKLFDSNEKIYYLDLKKENVDQFINNWAEKKNIVIVDDDGTIGLNLSKFVRFTFDGGSK